MQNLLADLNPEAHEFGKKVMADKKEIEAGTPMPMEMLPMEMPLFILILFYFHVFRPSERFLLMRCRRPSGSNLQRRRSKQRRKPRNGRRCGCIDASELQCTNCIRLYQILHQTLNSNLHRNTFEADVGDGSL